MSKHIQIQFIEDRPCRAVARSEGGFTPDECLQLAKRAEELNHLEWRDLWLDQAVVEEQRILEIGV